MHAFADVITTPRLAQGLWGRLDDPLAIDRFGWSQPLFYNVSLKHMRLHPEFVAAVNAIASPRRDVYEFGVYTGSRIKELSERIRKYGHMWGWDSFVGFPPEARHATRPRKLRDLYWRPGRDSAADAMREYDTQALLKRVRAFVGPPRNGSEHLTFVSRELLRSLLSHRSSLLGSLVTCICACLPL
jgi:hypothetical protein